MRFAARLQCLTVVAVASSQFLLAQDLAPRAIRKCNDPTPIRMNDAKVEEKRIAEDLPICRVRRRPDRNRRRWKLLVLHGGNRHGPDRVARQILAAWRMRSLTVLAVWASENRTLASFDNFFFDFNLLL